MNEIWHDERNLASLYKVLGFLSFKNSKSIGRLLNDAKFLPKPYDDLIEKTYTYASHFCIELFQTVVTLVRNSSCLHDQDHAHSTFIC
jgi:hypothetical protein